MPLLKNIFIIALASASTVQANVSTFSYFRSQPTLHIDSLLGDRFGRTTKAQILVSRLKGTPPDMLLLSPV